MCQSFLIEGCVMLFLIQADENVEHVGGCKKMTGSHFKLDGLNHKLIQYHTLNHRCQLGVGI